MLDIVQDVIDKMLDKVSKYINYNESKYSWGQKADGTWYCKEFKTDTINEADKEINEINMMLNKYNEKNAKENNKIELKTKK